MPGDFRSKLWDAEDKHGGHDRKEFEADHWDLRAFRGEVREQRLVSRFRANGTVHREPGRDLAARMHGDEDARRDKYAD